MQDVLAMEDNIRAHLAIASQQRASMTGSMINLHGFVVGANAVIWSSLIVAYISVGARLPSYVFLGTVVSALSIGLWRLYVHYLDNQITHLYPEIVLYECLSSVTNHPTGVRAHLVWNCPILNNIFTSGLSPEQQADIVKTLVRQRSIGNRGHRLFDVIAVITILVLICFSIWSVEYINADWKWYYFAALAVITFGLALVKIAYCKGQKNPRNENTVSDLIKNIDNSKTSGGNNKGKAQRG